MTDKAQTEALVRQEETKAQDYLDTASSMQVTSLIQRAAADAFLKAINVYISSLDSARKALVKPLNDHVKWINGQFTVPNSRAEAAKEAIKGKIEAWDDEQETKRKAEEARLRDEAEKKRQADLAKAQALRDKGKIQQAQNLQTAAETRPTPSVLAPLKPKGSSYHVEEWDLEFTDMALVPDEHRVVDWEATRKALLVLISATNGVVEIPGVRPFKTKRLVSGKR